MDPALQYIDDVMARLTVLTEVIYDYVVEVDTNKHGTSPRVEWEFGEISHEEPTDGNIYTEYQELVVTVWHSGSTHAESILNTRTLKNNLLVAAREIALNSFTGGMRVQRAPWRWIPPAVGHLGRKLTGVIEVPLPVPPRTQQYATIEEVGMRGIAVIGAIEEIVCEDNWEP